MCKRSCLLDKEVLNLQGFMDMIQEEREKGVLAYLARSGPTASANSYNWLATMYLTRHDLSCNKGKSHHVSCRDV